MHESLVNGSEKPPKSTPPKYSYKDPVRPPNFRPPEGRSRIQSVTPERKIMAIRQIHNCDENGSKKVVNVLLRSWSGGKLGGGMASTGEMSTCPASIDV
jgi:hypothetical protein